MSPGELVRGAQERHGLSQRRLARRAGASQAWISRLERDQVSPSVDSLERLLLAMGEGLRVGTEALPTDDGDRDWQRVHRTRPMAERSSAPAMRPALPAIYAASRAGDHG